MMMMMMMRRRRGGDDDPNLMRLLYTPRTSRAKTSLQDAAGALGTRSLITTRFNPMGGEPRTRMEHNMYLFICLFIY